jgi:hypothetical protein
MCDILGCCFGKPPENWTINFPATVSFLAVDKIRRVCGAIASNDGTAAEWRRKQLPGRLILVVWNLFYLWNLA